MGRTITMREFILPNGRQEIIEYPGEGFSEEILDKADKIREAGFEFQCEVLSTGDASFTITHEELGDLDMVLVFRKTGDQSQEVTNALSKMIGGFIIEDAVKRVEANTVEEV